MLGKEKFTEFQFTEIKKKIYSGSQKFLDATIKRDESPESKLLVA